MGGPMYDTIIRHAKEFSFVTDYLNGDINRERFVKLVDKNATGLVEAGLIATSRLLGTPEDVVCAQIHGMAFMKPVNNGELIEIKTRIAYLGRTSVTVYSEIYASNNTIPSVSSMATFVAVDKQNKPYEHGVKLTDEYIALNREICEKALNIRKTQDRPR